MYVVCSMRQSVSAPASLAERRQNRPTAQRAVVTDRDTSLARTGVHGPRGHRRRRLPQTSAAERRR